jgi:hypothetical protein
VKRRYEWKGRAVTCGQRLGKRTPAPAIVSSKTGGVLEAGKQFVAWIACLSWYSWLQIAANVVRIDSRPAIHEKSAVVPAGSVQWQPLNVSQIIMMRSHA